MTTDAAFLILIGADFYRFVRRINKKELSMDQKWAI